MIIIITMLLAIDFNPTLKLDVTQFEIYEPPAAAVAHDGTIVICDSETGNLIYFSADGKLLRRVSSKGQGPGELQMPGWIEWDPHKGVFRIGDYGNRRFSSWNLKGELKGETPFFKGQGFMFKVMPNDTLLLSRDLAGHFEGRPRLAIYPLNGTETEEIWAYELDKQREVTAADLPNDGGRVARLLRWDPRLSYDAGSNFIAVTWGETQDIQILDLTGKKQRQFGVEMPQYPLTKEQIQNQVMEFNERFRSLLAKNMVLREFWPATSQIIVDEADRIWTFSFQKEDGEPFSFRVFNSNGDKLGSGTLPEIPDSILKDKLYFFSQDEDEEALFLEAWSYTL